MSNFDYEEASDVLVQVLQSYNVFLGGSSMGSGLKTAANYYLKQQHHQDTKAVDYYQLRGAEDLTPEARAPPLEEPFYVVDIGGEHQKSSLRRGTALPRF